jgi:outer membrane protein assembly factor BamA
VSRRAHHAALVGVALLIAARSSTRLARAQDKPARDGAAEESSASDKPASRAGRWTVFPIISSTPETSLMLGVVTLYHFGQGDADEGGKAGTAARRSSVGMAVAYTFKNQFVLSAWPSVYLQGETWNLSGAIDALWFPDTLYATGRKSAADSSESFTQRSMGLHFGATRRLVGAFRAGLTAMAVHSTLTEVEPGGLLDSDQLPGSDGGAAIGIGPTVLWDDRDQDMAARSGSRVQLTLQGFHGALASDFDYVQISLDARHYFPLPRQHVLAVQAYSQLGYGDVPFQAQARLGGDTRLRGFFAGRYRDVHMFAAQLEYRLPLWWRIGATVFAGTGDVASEIGEFDVLDLKYAGGFGLRVALNAKDRVNLRGDFAVTSEGDLNFYLALGEAF